MRGSRKIEGRESDRDDEGEGREDNYEEEEKRGRNKKE